MIMTEAQKYEAAITCISRLAEGRDPGTGEQIDDPVLEDLKVVRCLYFAEKVLTKVLRDLPGNDAASQQRKNSIRSEQPGQDPFRSEKERVNSDWEDADGIRQPFLNRMDDEISFGQTDSEHTCNNENIYRRPDPENETAEGRQEAGGPDADRNPVTAGTEKEPAGKEREPAGKERKPAVKKKVPFPFEILSLFIYREDKSITHLLRQFAEPAGDLNIKLPNAAAIHKWFGANGYLVKESIEPGGKEFWIPTEKGKELGMYIREGNFRGNRIVSVMFDEKAQHYLAENLERIVNSSESNMQ